MPLTTAALVLALAQETKTFRDTDLGLVFSYPSAWSLKKEKHSTNLSFSAPDGSVSQVQIFKTQFRQEKSTFQEIQRQVADQMRRQVTRQWEEQILGVPLLLTRIEFMEGDVQKTTLIGLLYTATREKLNFRLDSTIGASQPSEDAWRAALMSLRTINGEMPQPEDPTKPLPNPNTTSGGRPVTTLSPDGNGDLVRTKNVHTVSKLGQQLSVYLPDGWTLSTDEEGRVFVSIEKLAGKFEMIFTSGSRQQVAGVLREANNASIDLFRSVTLREDPQPKVNRAGSYVASTTRLGLGSEGGELVVSHYVGTAGSVVWRLDYKCQSLSGHKADSKLIDRLIDLTAVEIAR